MATDDLGRIGAVLSPAEDGFVETAVELERLGYSTIWLTGGPLSSLSQIAEVIEATSTARVATGIMPVDRFSSNEVAPLYNELERVHPGRFILGLGGAHGVNHVEHARATLGPDRTLAIEQLVVVEADPDRARTLGRGPLGYLGRVPAYQASFRRMGFSDDDIATLGDDLVDAVIAWGSVDAIANRVDELRNAGADHVAVSVVSASPAPTHAEWAAVAAALVE